MSVAITCSFNRRGTLLAVGCNDGRIVIWDFLTRGISKIISAHAHPVCSVRLVFSNDVIHLENRKYFLCFHRVIETCMEA